jgi:xanthine dehydrogenase accessory factor
MTAATLQWILDELSKNRKVALATVVSTTGSVPGKEGAKLALNDFDIVGTVGGAGLELKVISQLREMLENATKPCGEVVTFGLNKGAKGYEVTPLDSLCGGHVTVALEILIPMPHILLMGGGHCAKAIAEACGPLNWSFSVQDSRAEYADIEGAQETHHSCPKDFLMAENTDSLTRFSDILLLGHDWKEDEERLLGLLFAGYSGRLGVIGSKSKWKAFSKVAIDAGITQERLDQVNCPIGLEIGAESPEEIAIAVIAEIIAGHKGINL